MALSVFDAFTEGRNYASWLLDHAIRSGENGALSNDPDGSGVTLLERYAFAMDARAAQPTLLPQLVVTQHAESDFPGFTFKRPSHTTDLNYRIQASTDLLNWNISQSETTIVSTGPGNLESISLRDAIPIDSIDDSRFLRVKVELQR